MRRGDRERRPSFFGVLVLTLALLLALVVLVPDVASTGGPDGPDGTPGAHGGAPVTRTVARVP